MTQTSLGWQEQRFKIALNMVPISCTKLCEVGKLITDPEELAQRPRALIAEGTVEDLVRETIKLLDSWIKASHRSTYAGPEEMTLLRAARSILNFLLDDKKESLP